MRAYQRWERVSQLRSPLGWTVHVGTNLARSLLRRQLAHRRAQRVLAAEPAGAREPDTPLRLTIAAALAQLTVHQREVLVLRYFLGLDTLECGELLGLDPNAVRQRTHRAAGALRRELAGEQHVREPQDER